MKMWAVFILSFVLLFLDNKSEIRANKKYFQIKNRDYLKFARANKRVCKNRSFVYVDDMIKEKS